MPQRLQEKLGAIVENSLTYTHFLAPSPELASGIFHEAETRSIYHLTQLPPKAEPGDLFHSLDEAGSFGWSVNVGWVPLADFERVPRTVKLEAKTGESVTVNGIYFPELGHFIPDAVDEETLEAYNRSKGK